MNFLKRLFGGGTSPTPPPQTPPPQAPAPATPRAESPKPQQPQAPPPDAPKLVRYRGLVFCVDGEYDLICDDKKIVRGIWYRDPSSVKNQARNRMVVAMASTRGLTVLDSDYATTIVGGMGGVEELTRPVPPVPGGAILWFASTREIF